MIRLSEQEESSETPGVVDVTRAVCSESRQPIGSQEQLLHPDLPSTSKVEANRFLFNLSSLN